MPVINRSTTLKARQAKAILEGLGLKRQVERARLFGTSVRTVREWELEDCWLPLHAANIVYLAQGTNPKPDGSILDLLPPEISPAATSR